MRTYKDLETAYNKSRLREKGVKLPKEKTQKGQALLYLYQNMGRVIKKSEAELCIAERLKQQPKDLQALRHLGKQDGYNILQHGARYNGRKLKRGEYVLLNLTEINPYYNFRRRTQSTLDFESVKRRYDNSCATCGSTEGEMHRYDNTITALEKGHRDPSLPMDNANIIPQCQICNKIAKDNWVFDQYGRPAKITVSGLLSLHTEEQKKEFLEALIENLT
tara:strand:+ start:444 stop:1103 length:660 start_codon:yes stop_codon:yes gene_type:complete